VNKIFIHDQLIRFSHCDPAGIVYFPRFFDLAHATMEDWFAGGVNYPLPDLIRDRHIGTPTVSIQCDFALPLRMGDTLRFELRVSKLGNAAIHLASRSGRPSSSRRSTPAVPCRSPKICGRSSKNIWWVERRQPADGRLVCADAKSGVCYS
jgi:acyl-CoA thioesterase FadM